MKKEQDAVRDFHEKAGCLINNVPTIPDFATRILRGKLIEEEFHEMLDAMGVHNLWRPKDESWAGHYNHVDVADAIGDLLYVVLGTAVSCGIDIEPVFNEIHRSNMTKFIDGYRRDDGKWIKGPSYEPANLKPILDAQV